MRAYHFTSNEHALDNLRNKRMKIATIGDMNDPFELLGMNLRDKEARKKFRSWRDDMASDYGFMCFSRNWPIPYFGVTTATSIAVCVWGLTYPTNT